jgi:hypothetical protein
MGLEAALMSAALFGPASTAGAAAAASSLVGALGTGIGALSAISGVSSLIGGIQGRNAGNEQAALAMQQANTRGIEQERVAQREARLVQEDALKTERRQKLAFLGSGVTLEGSPLLVMEETRRKGLDNVNEVLMAGSAAANAARLEGRVVASQAKSTGRQSFVSGLMGAASSGLNAYSALK